jgi:hypothetical protein
MKRLVTAIACLVALNAFAQNGEGEFTNSKALYTLPIPQGWTAEHSALTGKISNDGIEDLRLAPGCTDSKSEGYWTYASLWILDGDVRTDEKTIEKSLTFYLTNRANKGIEKPKVQTEKNSFVKVSVTELNHEKGDLKTYFAAIAMPYFKEAPSSLHCLVHVRKYPSQSKTFIFFEFSPKSPDDDAWKNLDQLWTDFNFIATQPYSSN